MSPSITIRPATLEDLVEVKHVCYSVWEDDYVPELLPRWLVNTEEFYPVVAEVKGQQIVGVGNLRRTGRQGWLEGLRVHADHHGHKIGTLVMEELLNSPLGREVTVFRLATGQTNTPVWRMSERLGFTPTISSHAVEVVSLDSERDEGSPLPYEPIDPTRTLFNDLAIQFGEWLPLSFFAVPQSEEGFNYVQSSLLYQTEFGVLLVETRHPENSPKLGFLSFYPSRAFNPNELRSLVSLIGRFGREQGKERSYLSIPNLGNYLPSFTSSDYCCRVFPLQFFEKW